MSKSTSSGVGLTTVVFIVFLILKLTDHIAWSWWWVFSPYWIPLGLVLVFFGGAALVGLPIVLVRHRRRQNWRRP